MVETVAAAVKTADSYRWAAHLNPTASDMKRTASLVVEVGERFVSRLMVPNGLSRFAATGGAAL